MTDEKAHFATVGLKIPPRQASSSSSSIERADHKFFRCELRDHGQWGVETQFFGGVDFFMSHRFEEANLGDQMVKGRDLAMAWANQ
jgi:hypothetical protein